MEMMSITTVVPFSPSIPRPKAPFSASSSSFCCSPNSIFFKKATIAVATPSFTNPLRKKGLTCNALFGLGVPELVVIAGVAALVFGPKQLPEVGRSIGKTVKSFQQAAKEFESEIKKEPDSQGEAPSENAIAVSQQQEDKQGTEVSSSKESV